MIVINIQLAIISLLSLLASLYSVIPAVLGYLLAAKYYDLHRFIQIPAYFTSSACIFNSLAHFIGLFFPYTKAYFITTSLGNMILVGSGLYYLLERTNSIDSTHFWSIEAAFISTWLFNVIFSLCLTCFTIGAVWFAYTYTDDDMNPLTPSTFDSEHLADSPDMLKQAPPLGLGIPQFEGDPPQTPHLQTTELGDRKSSWPSSLGSFHSVLDTQPKSANNQQHFDYNTLANNTAPAQSHLLRLHQSQPDLRKRPESIKFPKSPTKLNLSKSSFNLRRSPGKQSSLELPNSSHRKGANSGSGSEGSVITLPSLDAFALGIPNGGIPNEDMRTFKAWTPRLEEYTGDSRSVSGSSQLTGKVFPAAEYNKKINSAGFEKDEARPVPKPKKVKSIYELEKTRRFSKSAV